MNSPFLIVGYASILIPVGLAILAFWMIIKKKLPLKILGILILLGIVVLIILGAGNGGMVRGLL